MSKRKTPTGKPLPEYCFARGNMIWFTFPDPNGKWISKSTTFRLGQEQQAAQVVRGVHRKIAAATGRAETGPMTVREYIKKWLEDRVARGVGSVKTDRTRMNKYVIPQLGDLAMEAVEPQHARDFVRVLRARTGDDKIAPRTVLHIFRLLHTMFRSAVIDHRLTGVTSNPIVVEKGELPKKRDLDPEWRSKATYTTHEVERLISDPLIPVERRVQYALKSIAGMRHQEVAALCWRHIDYAAKPLARINIVQAFCSIKRVIKSTKTEDTRQVPVHPTLAKVLASWRLEHWERIYGRKPTDDDYIVPTRNMTCVNANSAQEAMLDDFAALGLRVKAGKKRNRGGHDLRAWYKTACVDDGGQLAIIRLTTHAPPKDVDSGYERFPWGTICREVGKLRVSILDGKVLELTCSNLQSEERSRKRWQKEVTPKGLEPFKSSGDLSALSSENEPSSDHENTPPNKSLQGALTVAKAPALTAQTARAIREAILGGDGPRALRILARASGMTPAPADELEAFREARKERAKTGAKAR